jgi:hypothetical protein
MQYSIWIEKWLHRSDRDKVREAVRKRKGHQRESDLEAGLTGKNKEASFPFRVERSVSDFLILSSLV